MASDVAVAILALAGTLAGSLLGALSVTSKTLYRIEQLEKKMDRHNNLVERLTVVEQSTKSAHHRLDELRQEMLETE